MPRLITRSSDIHAAGCFTLEDIPKGTVVLEYTGERITKEEGDVRYDGRPFTYLFGIGDGAIVIDGHGMAMFVNHSCDPNCETDEVDGRIIIKTLRDLKAGEELTYDYWLYDGDRRSTLPLWQQELPGQHVLARGDSGGCSARLPKRRNALTSRRGRTAAQTNDNRDSRNGGR